MTSAVSVAINHRNQLTTASAYHKAKGNNLLASWLTYSAGIVKNKVNELIEVERFLDTRDDELFIAHSREDESREFDRDRYGYDRLDDFHTFKSGWMDYLEENEDNLEW